MLDYLIEDNKLKPTLACHGIGDKEIHFIKELVLGSPEDAPLHFQWRGQPSNKAFLYDIVANHRNGIDVDKVYSMYMHIICATKRCLLFLIYIYV